jgi:lipoprotein NlpD
MAERMTIKCKWVDTAICAVIVGALLAGCSSKLRRAPVEDRIAGNKPVSSAPATSTPIASTPDNSAAEASPQPVNENSGKPGYYTVKTGDTLIHVALENGQNWRDLVKWNNLENPNMIEVGNVLRVVAPGTDVGAAASKPVTTAKVETRPLDAALPSALASSPNPASPIAAASGPKPAATAASGISTPTATVTSAAVSGREDDINWVWPSNGAVIAPFEEGKVKGVSLKGKAGDTVSAAADGKVVYAGSGLRGYGNLIILKHNNIYLTAYAHNQTLLVKEDQTVKRGQKIAEMGSTDTSSVRLHFEIRKQGKPIDPTKLLPQR